MSSPVKDFFQGKNIFITGATGFVGIGLVEKLIRSCDVGTIYLLIRNKRGKSPQERIDDLKKNLIFEKLKEEGKVSALSKLYPITGDVGEDNLGISDSDRELLIKNVDIVFHSAASLDFEAGLNEAVAINLLGTQRVLLLSRSMVKLKSFVHVSSAYVNSHLSSAEEQIYPPPGDVENLIKLATTLDQNALEEITPSLLGNHPNPYTITKAFAEIEVTKSHNFFPTAIVRPSMIMPSWQEPVPGWTMSKNGPQGFIMGASRGVVRRLPVNKNLVYDYIPVDTVINELIVAAYHIFQQRPQNTLIFHCTSSTCKPFSWNQVEDRINEMLHTYPLRSAVWYPTIKLLPSLSLFRLSAIFVHFIPAFFLDLMLRLTGSRPILVRLHRNVSRSLGRLAPFIFREFFFDNKNTKELQKILNESDRVTFNVDITTLQWDKFFINLVLGVRRYLNNEDIKTLPAALKKDRILFILNLLVQVVVVAGIWWIASLLLNISMLSMLYFPCLIYGLFSIL